MSRESVRTPGGAGGDSAHPSCRCVRVRARSWPSSSRARPSARAAASRRSGISSPIELGNEEVEQRRARPAAAAGRPHPGPPPAGRAHACDRCRARPGGPSNASRSFARTVATACRATSSSRSVSAVRKATTQATGHWSSWARAMTSSKSTRVAARRSPPLQDTRR